MREWLFNVMRELAERDELSPHYKELEQEAQVREKYAEYKVSNSSFWQTRQLPGFSQLVCVLVFLEYVFNAFTQYSFPGSALKDIVNGVQAWQPAMKRQQPFIYIRGQGV